jgi:hypothetical protein
MNHIKYYLKHIAVKKGANKMLNFNVDPFNTFQNLGPLQKLLILLLIAVNLRAPNLIVSPRTNTSLLMGPFVS